MDRLLLMSAKVSLAKIDASQKERQRIRAEEEPEEATEQAPHECEEATTVPQDADVSITPEQYQQACDVISQAEASRPSAALNVPHEPPHGGPRLCTLDVLKPVSINLESYTKVQEDASKITLAFQNAQARQKAMSVLTKSRHKFSVPAARRTRNVGGRVLDKDVYTEGTRFIPKRSFQRLCKEIFDEQSAESHLRMTEPALQCLQEASEEFLAEIFGEAMIFATHARRRTLFQSDLALAVRRKLK